MIMIMKAYFLFLSLPPLFHSLSHSLSLSHAPLLMYGFHSTNNRERELVERFGEPFGLEEVLFCGQSCAYGSSSHCIHFIATA